MADFTSFFYDAMQYEGRNYPDTELPDELSFPFQMLSLDALKAALERLTLPGPCS